MEGIDILNQTEIMTTPDWCVRTFMIFAISAVVFMVLAYGFSGHINAWFWSSIILSISCFTGAVVMSVVASANSDTPTGRYKYECLIDESVDFVDIYERYEVIDQNGKIWTLEDKELED